MTAVFVNGNPDTYHVWDFVCRLLPDHDSVALSLPGFGCPVPAGKGSMRSQIHLPPVPPSTPGDEGISRERISPRFRQSYY